MMGFKIASDDDFTGLPGPEWPLTSIIKSNFENQNFSIMMSYLDCLLAFFSYSDQNIVKLDVQVKKT